MKRFFCFIFLFISFLPMLIWGEEGVVADYDFNGKAIGATKLKGNMKILLKKGVKRLQGNIFYQETGNPFPDLDEIDIIVNFKKGTKYIYTSEAGKKITTSLKDEFNLIKKEEITLHVKKYKNMFIARANINIPPELGGNQQYMIKFEYTDRRGEEEAVLKKIIQPSAIDIVSIFVDNEKIVDILNKNLVEFKNKLPEKFLIKWIQNNTVKLNVEGKIKAGFTMDLTDEDFIPIE